LQQQLQWIAKQPDITKIAVMPDSHPGLIVPNGLVVATRSLLYPQLIGGDIGCGYSALRFNSPYTDLNRRKLESLLQHLTDSVPTIKQKTSIAQSYRNFIDQLGPLSDERLLPAAFREGSYQLGTLGRGNHFIELAHDDARQLWCVVHSGSRGMGQIITNHHLQIRITNRYKKHLVGIPVQSAAGTAYLADMTWGCRYATLNRSLILNAVADFFERYHSIDADNSSYIDSPHNFLSIMTLEREKFYIHRKSANSAALNQLGIIAGTMATGCFITQGLGESTSLQSSAHGAGRAMSRTVAFEKINARDINEQMTSIVYRKKNLHRMRDEGPQAYKNVYDVMHAQKDQIRIVETLTPILNDKRV
jgi:tRNA-splicing ligase RtcB (3'-phosphate/5'-hydroxy nucleic acid ligase)